MPPLNYPPARRLPVLVLACLLTLCGAQARAAESCSSASFKSAGSFALGSSSGYVAAADFDGDGRPDLVTSNGTTYNTWANYPTVTVYYNDGAGWFGAPRSFPAGQNPGAIAAGDFNGDGRPDVAVINVSGDTSGSGNTVSVLLGDGSGGLAAPINFNTGNRPTALAVADFNGDGRADITAGSYYSQDVAVLLGAAAGPPAPAPGSPYAFGQGLYTLSVADFNNDNKPDIFANTYGFGVFVMVGDGAGRLGVPSKAYAAGSSAAAADFNNDGKVDLVAESAAGLAVLPGDGAGGFGSPANVSVAFQFSPVFTAKDIDGDGKADVAASDGSSVLLFRGDGAGGLTLARSYAAAGGVLAAQDFDGDGKPDLVTGGSILKNRGGLDFEAATAVQTLPRTIGYYPTYPDKLAFADFNGDGRTDVAATQRSMTGPEGIAGRVTVMLADGLGNYTLAPPLVYNPATTFSDIETADFNKDGKADIAVSIPYPSNSVSVRLGNGDGTFAAPVNVPISPYGSYPYGLAVADFNGDTKPDLVTLNAWSNNVTVWLGDGAGAFTQFWTIGGVGVLYEDLAVGDLLGDGSPDVVITDSTNSRVIVLVGLPSGGLYGPFYYGTGAPPRAVITGDFNQDQKTDIAVAAAAPAAGGAAADYGLVSVLLRDANSGFPKAETYSVAAQPVEIASADFDGDGRLDLATASAQARALSVLTNGGAGVFRSVLNIPLQGGDANTLAALDLNSDNKPDVATTFWGNRAVSLLYNNFSAPLPCVSVTALTVTEGNSGDTNAEVSVRLSEASAQVVKVNYALTPYPAAAGSDFLSGFGTVVFQPGETTKTIPVAVAGDALDELEEYFTVSLSAPSNAQLGEASARVTIADDDAGPVLSVADASANEGFGSNSGTLTFRVTLSAPSAKTVSVDYATADGTAASTGSGQDYFGRTGRLDFAPGVTSLNVTVSVNGDSVYEADETLLLNLSNNTESTIGDGQAQGTILNDDAFPTLTVLDASAFESATGDTTATFTVRLSNPSSQPVTVNYSTADATASAGADYNAASGALTFGPGETNKSIAVTVKDDQLDENVETFNLNLADVAGATLGDAQGLGTIFDNDGPALSVGDVSAKEGQSGLTNFVFTVTLSAASPQPVSVRFSTAPGTAVSNGFPVDFQGTSGGFVQIPAGATSGTFIVRVVGDLLVEPDETFLVNLSNPTDATVADAQAQATILNDDGPGKLQFASAAFSANESDPSALITVVRVDGATGAATVGYTASGGTATDGADYTSVSGTLSFAEGQTSKTFSVPLMNDVPAEPEETVSLTLSSPTGAALGDLPAAVLRIGDDPRPVIQFAAAAQTASETDRTVSVMVRRLGDASKPVSVWYSTHDGTAAERRDYNLTLGPLSFAAGETEKAVEVLLTDDAVPESPETFTLRLSVPTDCRLGDVTTTTVTLEGPDDAGAVNPLDAGNEFFVRQHYHDFLNREPDAPGLAFWTNEINQCGSDVQCRDAKRVHVSAAFFLSIEFQQTGYLVYRTYKAAYGSFPGTPLTVNLRQFMPDTQGLGRGVRVGIGDWEAQLEANKRAYLAEFVQRAEFAGRYPASMTDGQFVDALNANAGGALSPAERDQLVEQLAAGAKGRDEVLRAVAEDPDFAAGEFNRAFVLMQYYGYLRRNPNDTPDADFSGYQYWLSKLNEFGGDFVRAEMVKAFLDSIEYRKRFGQ